jgi:chromosome segregation ATPase
MIYIRLAVSLAVLLAAAWFGYHWGSSGLEEARAQLKNIAATAEQAQAAQETAQKRLDDQLKAQAADFEQRLKTEIAAQEADKKSLAESLGRANERIAQLGTQRRSTDTQLDQTRRELASATGAHRTELEKREQELLALRDQLARKEQGLSCLAASVPAEELALLNRSLPASQQP